MVVAIPQFYDAVAPCFEAAKAFLIVRLDQGVTRSREVVECGGCEGFGRIQMLRDHRVGVLICNGIKGFYRDLLQAAGVLVVSHVSADVSSALADFLDGHLTADDTTTEPVDLRENIPLPDLICWTRELFTVHGYRVMPGEDIASFPIDLVAELDCPLCGKLIRVAICCGAHTYRPNREIELLHLAAASGYHARVYVRSATPRIEQCCRDYAVDLIDPDAKMFNRDRRIKGRIPLLQSVVAGHEAAFTDHANPKPKNKHK